MLNEKQSKEVAKTEGDLCKLLEQLHSRSDNRRALDEDRTSQSSDVLALFNALKNFEKGNSKFWTRIGKNIEKQERVFQEIHKFPPDIRLRVEEQLKAKIAARKSTLDFYLGDANVTILYVALLLLWGLDFGLFGSTIPDEFMIILTCAIAVVYPLRIVLGLRLQRLELMVSCLELGGCRVERTPPNT